VPPRSDLALPIEETVTSICWPLRENGGSVPVTITAATFFSCSDCPGGRLTPMFESMLITLWTVKGVCVVWSPEPSRPTTRP